MMRNRRKRRIRNMLTIKWSEPRELIEKCESEHVPAVPRPKKEYAQRYVDGGSAIEAPIDMQWTDGGNESQ